MGGPKRWPLTPSVTRSRPRSGVPGETHRSRVQPLLAEDRLQQARLARSVRPEHREELSRPHVEVESGPERAVAETEGPAAELQHGLGGGGGWHYFTAAEIALRFSVIHET